MKSTPIDRRPGCTGTRSALTVSSLWLGLFVAPLVALQAQPPSGDTTTAGDDATPALTETLVVSANRDPVPMSEVGSSVTVIGLEEIEQRNQLYVSDLLRTVSGVEVTQTGGPGKASSVRIRGGSASQALILVDGVRLNTATGSSVDLANLTADGIERIEVLRGPQATYGSEGDDRGHQYRDSTRCAGQQLACLRGSRQS